MAALDPVSLTRSNGGSPAPTTPRGQASKEINTVIESVALEFGLPLRPRIGPFSPSKRIDGYAERCIDHINFLFFRNRIEMFNVINSFREDKQRGYITCDLLEEFYSRTRDAVHLEQHRPPSEKLHLSGLEVKNPAPKLSLSQTKLIPTIKKSSKLNNSKLTEAENHNPEERSLPANQPFVFDPELDTTIRGTKRLSDQDLSSSPQYVRPHKRRQQQPCLKPFISYKASPTNPSFTSTNQTNAASIYTSHENRSFATTVATSFDSIHDEPWDSSSADYGDDIECSQVDELMMSFEQPSFDQSDSTLLRGPSERWQSLDESLKTRDAPSPKHIPRSATKVLLQGAREAALEQAQSPKAKSKAKILEHRLVRSLPTDGLFGSSVTVGVEHTSFHHLWESYRLAIAAEKPFRYYADEHEMYADLPSGLQFQRTPASTWEAATDPVQSANVILKANLIFNSSASAEKLLTLSLQPLKCERASRLQRQFGSSRFLYVEMPQVHTFKGIHLKGQESLLKSRFQEWMCSEKEFLGRTWRVFHVQDVKKKHSKENVPSQRLVLFAVDGSRLRKVSIKELLDWAIPLDKNGHQGFCKAYARLDLFLSQTIPTVNFSYKEIEYVKDTRANNEPETDAFNDSQFKFTYPTSGESVVMNDGCSLISVGAAKELCEILGINGVRPVAFQGRMNGCKGVWMISAPYDSTDPRHLGRWIHITESQRKVVPRPEDLTNNCEPDRWSFELVKYTSTPKASTLNPDFIPILENRHVSRDTLQQVIESQLEMDFSAFLESLNDPVSLRRWLHSEFSGMEETNRSLGIREAGNFPSDWVEKCVLLLESGFSPLKSQYLASCTKQATALWLFSIRSKLKIHLGKSTMALGVADPTGCLKPGEIHIVFSETFRDAASGEVWPHLKGEVLVARHPSLRCSDIQKVKAVYKEELSHLIDVVVFPSRGCVPLAHKLQGGDYDGDTFWLCWDQRLTTAFENAPAQLEEPKLEYYGIKKDTRKLGEVLGIDKSVDRWLSESFKFKLQEDLLGKATKLHSKLAYKENSIASKKVDDLAGLHDLIIDSAKNGYTFTLSAFNNFTKKRLGLKKSLDKPAYESWMDPSMDSTVGRLNPNLRHIIDYLLFEVVNPRIEQFNKDCQNKLSEVDSFDEDLVKPYLDRKQDSDPIVARVLQQMVADLARVNSIGNSAERMTKEVYSLQANKILEAYTAVQPIHTKDRVIQEWLKRTAPHSSSTWELIKASAFYMDRHRNRLTLAFLVAGKELCHIKAMATSSNRVVVDALYATYKPRKEKKAINKRQAPLPVTESSESSEGEFFDALE